MIGYFNKITVEIKTKDAQKFARRSRRKKVLPSDIDYSLKARSIEVK